MVVLSGEGLADAVDVRFIDDSTGAHAKAKFRAAGEGRLAVTVPRLGKRCKRPVIVVQTPSGVTMTLGTDVIARITSLAIRGRGLRRPRQAIPGGWGRTSPTSTSARRGAGGAGVAPAGPHDEECRSRSGLRARGSILGFGPKGMVTAFAKDDSFVGVGDCPVIRRGHRLPRAVRRLLVAGLLQHDHQADPGAGDQAELP